MAFAFIAFRRFMLKEVKPLGMLYSTAANNSGPHGRTAGREFRGMFAMWRIKKNWELVPLIVIISCAVTGACSFIFYASQTRDDVRYFSKINSETTDLLNPKKRKLIVFNQEYRPMNELAEAYNDMEATKAE